MKIQATQSQSTNKTDLCIKVGIGYKKYIDYAKIYCLDSQRSLLAVQALGKHKILFTTPQYNYNEIIMLSLETALDNVEKGEGKVLLEEI